VDVDKLCAALEEDGAIAARLPGYERRDAQLDLVRLIVRAFNEDAAAAAEAGTGVGKSFAYLLPALEFALANDERIVISTATITLQQQLYEKDIPLVLSALGKNVKCILVKGRANYLCRRRLAEAQMEPPLDNNEYEELSSIGSWVDKTKTGDKSDLSFFPSPALWSRLCCESDTCLAMRCAERERCFFMVLRKEALDARLLVVNHHLLFADLAARHEGAGYESAVVLPPFTRVIIDEAHTIEESATSFFSKGWSRLGIIRSLNRLYRKRRNLETGLLLRLLAALPASQGKASKKIIQSLREAVEEADAAALTLCGGEGIFRLSRGNGSVMDPLGALRQPLEKMQKNINSLVTSIRGMTEHIDQEDPAVWEISALLRRFESVAEVCGAFLEFGLGIHEARDDSEVFWLERQGSVRNDPWVTFTVTPVSIAGSLKDALFEANKTVVCVSATLSIAGSFRFWTERTGAALANRNFLYGVFPSPFPYNERTLLAVPSDAPLPDSPDWEAFICRA